MTLREKQSKFVLMLSRLIAFAYSRGYELTLGDAYRDDRVHYGHPNSLHRIRLAIDLNLFKEGKYLHGTEDHRELGEYWESIGGSWGGRFRESPAGAGNGFDGNHYSLEHDGVR